MVRYLQILKHTCLVGDMLSQTQDHPPSATNVCLYVRRPPTSHVTHILWSQVTQDACGSSWCWSHTLAMGAALTRLSA